MADVKNSSFLPLLLTTAALISSCGGDFAPEGTFRGTVVMEDGTTMVTLELKADNKAEVRGLFPKTARGTWEKDTTGLGFGKNGVVATFDSKKDGTAFRVVLMLQPHDEGMTLADIRVRLLLEGKYSMLQSYTLKEKKPLLRRSSGGN